MSAAVAVLITCFNRRESTLRCLRRLDAQQGLDEITLTTYLVDDGSTDGTWEAVRSNHPHVRLLRGTGSLYWVGGMRLADAAAWPTRPDYLLWLNDDVQLCSHALRVLISAARKSGNASIVVGALRDPFDGSISYGGYISRSARRCLDLELVEPNGSLQVLATMNGNVVLVPRAVRDAIGGPDARFTHNMADMDYALRARSAGFGVVLAPMFVGWCQRNRMKGQWASPALPMRQRIQMVRSVKTLPPREWLVFTRRHCGWRWPRYFAGPYVRAILARWMPIRN